MDILTGINETTLKNLQDRSLEKRKQAASELAEIIDKLIMRKEYDKIFTRIDMFSTMVSADATSG